MRVLDTVDGFRREVSKLERPLGLVPTMGALHAGHMSLVERARAESATLAVSVFVNPSQFGPAEDYATYPRDTEADLARLESAGADLVFAPATEEMYPAGFDTYVDIGRIGEGLEGAARPGHFRGVATVVCKLLSTVRPDRAYFGQKDAQQAAVVRRLNSDLNLGAEIVVCPTVRERDGLASSSRDIYLSPDERKAATVLFRALSLALDLGGTDAEEVRRLMAKVIDSEPIARTDYVSVADPETFEELDEIRGEALASLAVHIGKTRLIDNMLIEER
jgi:pantoate--beta-alanine ligase